MSIAASIYFPVKDQIANAIEIRIVIIQNKRVNNVLKFFSKNFIVRHNMNPRKAIPIGKCTPLNSWMYPFAESKKIERKYLYIEVVYAYGDRLSYCKCFHILPLCV